MKKEDPVVELPEEIVEDILIRLPVKSLMRFQCVCKAWRTRFCESSFASRYQKTLESDHGCSTIFLHDRVSNVFQTLQTIKADTSTMVIGKENILMHRTCALDCSEWVTEMVGSCNGMVCLSEHMPSERRQRIALWNPTLRSFKILHASPMPMLKALGFGYDAKADDYKVMRLEYSLDNELSNYYDAEIYSLRTGSWRKIPGYASDGLLLDPNLTAYVNGVYHWLSSDSIVSFDMVEETFKKTNLPMCLISHYSGRYCLFETSSLDGCLALIPYYPNLNEKLFDVWVLKEVGVRESWVKQLQLGPFSEIRCPLGFWENQKFFMKTMSNEIVVFDLKGRELEKLGIYSDRFTTRVFSYSPNLAYIIGVLEKEEGIIRMPLSCSSRKRPSSALQEEDGRNSVFLSMLQ